MSCRRDLLKTLPIRIIQPSQVLLLFFDDDSFKYPKTNYQGVEMSLFYLCVSDRIINCPSRHHPDDAIRECFDSSDYNWIGESFSVLMSDLLDIPGLVTIGPDKRNVAFDRLGIPSGTLLTKATAIKLAEQNGADLLLIGTYNVAGDGENASVALTALLIDVREGRILGNEFQRGGLVTDLQRLEGELAWTILYQRNQALPYSRDAVVQKATSVSLKAFEDYVKAALTPDREDKILFLRRAMKEANNKYPDAAFELGKNYYFVGDYEEATKWLSQMTADDAHWIESLFYLGVSQGNIGKLNEALANLNTLLPKLPLYETYNNAGVIYLKKNQPKDAIPLLKGPGRSGDTRCRCAIQLWLRGVASSGLSACRFTNGACDHPAAGRQTDRRRGVLHSGKKSGATRQKTRGSIGAG